MENSNIISVSILGEVNSGRHSFSKDLSIKYGNITSNEFSINEKNIERKYKINPIPIMQEIDRLDTIKLFSDILFYIINGETITNSNIISTLNNEIALIIEVILNSNLNKIVFVINKCEKTKENFNLLINSILDFFNQFNF